MDVLTDLVLHPVFDAGDIAKERGVILEEIKMDQDNPDYLVTKSSPKVSGRTMPSVCRSWHARDVRRFERPVVSRFYGHHFASGNLIVSAPEPRSQAFCRTRREIFRAREAREKRIALAKPKTFSRINLRNKKSLEQSRSASAFPRIPWHTNAATLPTS